MTPGARRLVFLNRLFKPVRHPFNLENKGEMTYGEWEFSRAALSVSCFSPVYTEKEMFSGKKVLDIGCGEAGKSLYYLSRGAESVIGIDAVGAYKEKAEALSEKLGFKNGFSFVTGNASSLPFPDGSFDTVIMDDFFEHASEPEKAVREALRVLCEGGRLFIDFPPYYHPWGAHLSDAINIPWVQLLFCEKDMISAYCHLISDKPDCEKRMALKLKKDADGNFYIGYINKMTLGKARKLFLSLGINPEYEKTVPLRRPGLISRLPIFREALTHTKIYVFRKQKEESRTWKKTKNEEELSTPSLP